MHSLFILNDCPPPARTAPRNGLVMKSRQMKAQNNAAVSRCRKHRALAADTVTPCNAKLAGDKYLLSSLPLA